MNEAKSAKTQKQNKLVRRWANFGVKCTMLTLNLYIHTSSTSGLFFHVVPRFHELQDTAVNVVYHQYSTTNLLVLLLYKLHAI